MAEASFDDIPSFLKRSKFVKPENSPLVNTTKRFQSTKDKFDSARQMFDDADDAIEVINASKAAGLPSSPSWKRQPAVPCREMSYKPLTHVVNKAGIADMIRKRMAMADKSNKKRTTKAPAKRRRVVERTYDEEEDEDDIEDIEDSDDDDGYCESLEEDEEVSEDEELTSGDERFIANDDSEDEESDAASEYSEGEAEFSDNEESDESSSDEECVPCESDEDEDEQVTPTKIIEQHQEVYNAVSSGTRRQIVRKLEPILITVDTRLFNVLVCMFWSYRAPFVDDVTPIGTATVEAIKLFNAQKPLKTHDTSIGASYVWLFYRAKLRAGLLANYESKSLHAWVKAFDSPTAIVDEYPEFVYLATRTQRCFLSDNLCRTGVRLIDNETKRPIETLWFDASDFDINKWVLNVVRFLFLPAVIGEYCKYEIPHQNAELSDPEIFGVHEWITKLSQGLSTMLYQEHIIPSDTAVLERGFGSTR